MPIPGHPPRPAGKVFLAQQGAGQYGWGDGLLNRDEPVQEAPDLFLYNPSFPVPTLGGRNIPQSGLVAGPIDQSPVEKRFDVLCYTTGELSEDTEVTGPLEFHLFASTSARDTDFHRQTGGRPSRWPVP